MFRMRGRRNVLSHKANGGLRPNSYCLCFGGFGLHRRPLVKWVAVLLCEHRRLLPQNPKAWSQGAGTRKRAPGLDLSRSNRCKWISQDKYLLCSAFCFATCIWKVLLGRFNHHGPGSCSWILGHIVRLGIPTPVLQRECHLFHGSAQRQAHSWHGPIATSPD